MRRGKRRSITANLSPHLVSSYMVFVTPRQTRDSAGMNSVTAFEHPTRRALLRAAGRFGRFHAKRRTDRCAIERRWTSTELPDPVQAQAARILVG